MDLERLAIKHTADAIAVHDVEGCYLWASPGHAGILGWTSEELTGRSVYEFLHPDDVADAQVAHEAATAVPTTQTITHRVRTADDSYHWVESAIRYVAADHVLVSSARPIAQRPPSLDGLAAERHWADQLRELARQKEGFLTAISHRVRNPLTIVHGLAEMLEVRWRDLDDDTVDRLLDRLVVNSSHLFDLLEDVTRAERLSRRARAMQAVPLDLFRTVEDVIANLECRAHPVDIEVEPGSLVFADPQMLRTVLRILLCNVDRHTPTGTPVRISLQRRAGGSILVVDDDGPGIPPQSRADVFTAFGRAASDDPDPGLGLGLHTVAEIAAAHRGRAWVEDGRNGGAAFHVLLPSAGRESVRTHVDIDLSERARARPEQPLTVLAVDDDPAVTQLISMALQAEGHTVYTAANGVDALTQVFEVLPDVVVLDEMMPEMDGREVTRSIRSSPRVQHIPIIVCSALSGERDRWESRVAGADAFLAKPFDTEVLAELVADVHERTRR